jgi:SET domain-containing protein
MLFYKVKVASSPVAGRGVFADEPIPKGAVAGLLSYDNALMTEQEYQDAQRRGEDRIIKTGIRLVGDYFIYRGESSDEDFLNHSEDPNLLYHCGILFARRDIPSGVELTVDYKYFLATDDVFEFDDVASGRKATGVPGKEALLHSCRELIELYRAADMDAARYSDYARRRQRSGNAAG